MDVIRAHTYCSRNKDILNQSERCGCFYCIKIFPISEVKIWTDDEQTAVCPFCNMDAVLGDAAVELSSEFLEQMQKRWFK
jgi:hypothetical protein